MNRGYITYTKENSKLWHLKSKPWFFLMGKVKITTEIREGKNKISHHYVP